MTSKKTQQIFVFIGKVLHLHHVLQQKEKKIKLWQHCMQHISSSFIFTFTLAIK